MLQIPEMQKLFDLIVMILLLGPWKAFPLCAAMAYTTLVQGQKFNQRVAASTWYEKNLKCVNVQNGIQSEIG